MLLLRGLDSGWTQILHFPSPLCESERAKDAFISLSPRPKKTATPWTRAAACSPASQRWCTTTALSACLSTALSTWPCCTQWLAFINSTPPHLGKQNKDTSGPKWTTGLSVQCVLLLCPFHQSQFIICLFIISHIMCVNFVILISSCRLYLKALDIFLCLWCAADAKHPGCCFACEHEGSAAQMWRHFSWGNVIWSLIWPGYDVLLYTVALFKKSYMWYFSYCF